jgi:large repetitive protein
MEEEGFDAGPPRTDAGKRDGSGGALDGGDEPDAPITVDSGKKDGTTVTEAGTDASATEGGTDASPTDSSTSDVVTPPADAGPPSTTLVINEIDYDQIGTDNDAAAPDKEFVELYNKSANIISLVTYELRFYNGSDGTLYRTVVLTGTIAAGGYYVIAAPGFSGTANMTFTSPVGGQYIQNGTNDSIAIYDTIANQIVDTITYGKTASAPPNAFLVETNVPDAIDSNTTVGSLIRNPNATDTNNSNADWKFSSTLTPGAAN